MPRSASDRMLTALSSDGVPHHPTRPASHLPLLSAGRDSKYVYYQSAVLRDRKQLGVVLLRFSRRNHNGYGRADAYPAFDL